MIKRYVLWVKDWLRKKKLLRESLVVTAERRIAFCEMVRISKKESEELLYYTKRSLIEEFWYQTEKLIKMDLYPNLARTEFYQREDTLRQCLVIGFTIRADYRPSSNFNYISELIEWLKIELERRH